LTLCGSREYKFLNNFCVFHRIFVVHISNESSQRPDIWFLLKNALKFFAENHFFHFTENMETKVK